MALHVKTDTTAPAAAPDNVGEHFIDTASGRQWLAVGTSAVGDWHEVGLVETGQDYILLKVLGTTDYVKVYAVANDDGDITLQIIP